MDLIFDEGREHLCKKKASLQVHFIAISDAHVFPDFLIPVLTFNPKPPTTFLTCFCRGER